MGMVLLSGVQAYQDPPIVTGIPKGAQMSLPILCDSHSMSPLIDCDDRIYGRFVTKQTVLLIGDIVTIKKGRHGILTVHRIVDAGTDEKGIWYITKGDDNVRNDFFWLGKLRREDFQMVVTGIKKVG